MKKVLFLTMASVMVAFGANAQKGDWFLSGSLSELDLNTTFVEKSSTLNFDFAASGGYFISDKFAVDALVGLDYSKMKDVKGNDVNAYFGVGARYYFAGNFFGRVGYEGRKVDNVKAISSLLGVSAGYDWFVSDKVFFEPAIYYKKDMAKGGANQLGLSLGVGVKF